MRHLIFGLFALGLGSGAWADNGQALFLQNCSLCHQATGMGLPGQFPRLSGRVSKIAATPKGREYLIDVLTTGLSGTLQVDGQAITGVMPPFTTLPAGTVADILSYVTSLGEQPAKPFTEAEVTAGRKQSKDMEKTHAEREALQSTKVIE
jgi:mono/diheme cytochrome c family protein